MSDLLEPRYLRLFWDFTGPATDAATKRRIALLVGLTAIGIFFLLAFGVVALIQGNLLLVATDIGSACILLANLIDAKCRKIFEFNILIGMSLTSILYIVLYACGGDSTFLWYYTYPLIACYILGAKRGGSAALLMTLPVFLLMAAPANSSFFANYHFDFEIKFLFSYLVVVAFSYLIEKARAKNEAELKHVNLFLEKEVEKRTAQIHRTNQDLIEEIKKRKEAAKEIQLSSKSFLTILNSIDAAIYVVGLENHEIIFMNQYMIETYGQDMTGQTCWKAFKGEKAPCVDCPRDKILDEHNNPKDVYNWQEKNEITNQWLIRSDRAIQWIDGRVVHLQVAADITRLKEMEERLLQAQKMESIGFLAGGIAHDFNNILCPIIGWSELLIGEFSPESRKYENARQILSAGMRGRDLVNQILTFSRQSDNNYAPIRLQPILKEVIKLGRSTIPSNIDFVHHIEARCGTVRANSTQIHQIAMNLITNAYHAVEHTGGEITVGLKVKKLGAADLQGSTLLPGQYATFSVSDTGSGIKPTDRNKIFDPYFTTKERGKGTGLGLAVVYAIVQEHSGDITVHSEVGKGSTFKVYLPIIDTPEEPVPLKMVTGPYENTAKIMLVDDEKTNTEVMTLLLQRQGYQVSAFNRSMEALTAFKRYPDGFDLVITDMAMPTMTGDQLCKELFSIQPQIPVIIITGFSEKMDQERAMALGARGFLMKPVAHADLIQAIHTALDRAN